VRASTIVDVRRLKVKYHETMRIEAETFMDLIFHIILVQNSKWKNHYQKIKDQDNIKMGFSR